MLAGLVPIQLYGVLIMAGGLLFQWLPQVSRTLTKILNSYREIGREGGETGATTGIWCVSERTGWRRHLVEYLLDFPFHLTPGVI